MRPFEGDKVVLGPYEIAAQIGVGGMGEVYRATDTTLNRQVAVKVLPESLASDAERIARFEREAKTLASLNHPNIAQIYGFEKSSGVHALVMELVEGPTLADRIAQGAIPVDEALPTAKQIAEALEAAHEQGIIHRDLKPANVKVRPDGVVKVLDFGLAKALEPMGAMSPGLSQAPTITTPAMTQAGMILGTAAYMSPEQAKGRTVDKRSDVWAFGVVLFEMLTGHGTFEGGSVPDVLASVLKTDPDWASLPQNLHPRLRLLLERCLEKQIKDRYQAIPDARVDIQRVLTDPSGALVQPVVAAVHATPASKLPWIAAVIGILVASATVWNLRSIPGQPVTRFTIPLPENPVAQFSSTPTFAAVSPDGRTLVYTTENQLYQRELGQFDAQLIPGAEDAATPFFSPDGQRVAFWAGGLKKVSLAGGFPEDLLDEQDARGASWHNDDTIVFGTGDSGLWTVSANAGEPEPLTTVSDDGTVSHRWPDVLANGNAVLFTIQTGLPETGSGGTSLIAVADLETGSHTSLGLVPCRSGFDRLQRG